MAQFRQGKGCPLKVSGVQIHHIRWTESTPEIGQCLGAGEFIGTVEYVKGRCGLGHFADILESTLLGKGQPSVRTWMTVTPAFLSREMPAIRILPTLGSVVMRA